MNRITADTLHGWILDGQELALLDAREDGAFGASHLFWAVPCGLARKEIRARALLPRLGNGGPLCQTWVTPGTYESF